jgi:hypothetical protein
MLKKNKEGKIFWTIKVGDLELPHRVFMAQRQINFTLYPTI